MCNYCLEFLSARFQFGFSVFCDETNLFFLSVSGSQLVPLTRGVMIMTDVDLPKSYSYFSSVLSM